MDLPTYPSPANDPVRGPDPALAGTHEPDDLDRCPTCRQPWPEDLTHPVPDRAAAAGLTARETQVMELIGSGLQNTEIADELGVSVNSVKSYIRSAYRRLGIGTRPAAVLWARGLEPPTTGDGAPLTPS